ncbi:MAG: serine protease [Alphaproteobacteria bacterium]
MFAAACGSADRAAKPEGAAPIALSYHRSVTEDEFRFDGYQRVVQASAGAYVRVIVRGRGDDGPGSKEMAGGIVNGASGTIIARSGLIITAAHIAIDPKLDAEIITLDGRAHKARILRVDPARELAVLQMQPFAGMQVAELADSARLAKGDPVFAVGTPGNRPGVVSLGRVVESRRASRLEYNGYGFDDAIKLKIDVEPGNSGGPVFDRDGRVIGIVASFVLGDVDASKPTPPPRLAYAVPSNSIRAFLQGQN